MTTPTATPSGGERLAGIESRLSSLETMMRLFVEGHPESAARPDEAKTSIHREQYGLSPMVYAALGSVGTLAIIALALTIFKALT